jgi:hypothetical protein
MIAMKKIIPAILFVSVSLVVGLFSSCDKSCGDCGPIKTCQQGQCLCPQGYEGDNCEILSATKFIGTYQVYDQYASSFNGMTSQGPYNDYIIAGSKNDEVVFSNFENLGISVQAIINTNNIAIPSQTIGSFTVEGQGTFNTYSRTMTIQANLSTQTSSTAATITYQHF